MKSRSKIILAIAPGNQTFGIAVFNGIELVYFSLSSVQKGKSKRLLKNEIIGLINECIDTFQPQVIAVKAVSQYQRKSPALRSITRIVEQQTEASEIRLVKISIDQIKEVLDSNEKPTQRRAFENLTVLYPELRQFFERPNKWQNEYYHNLFSAVSVGVVMLRSLAKEE